VYGASCVMGNVLVAIGAYCDETRFVIAYVCRVLVTFALFETFTSFYYVSCSGCNSYGPFAGLNPC